MRTADRAALRALFRAAQEAKLAGLRAEVDQLERVLARYEMQARSKPRSCPDLLLRELRRGPQTTTHLVALSEAAGYMPMTARVELCRLRNAGRITMLVRGQRGRTSLWGLCDVDP